MRCARRVHAQKQPVKENVTDHTSTASLPLQPSSSQSAALLIAKAAQTGRRLSLFRLFAVHTAASARHGSIFCHFCGRQGRFINSS